MSDDLKRNWIQRDRVTRAMTTDGLFRAAVIHNSRCVRTAQEKHKIDGLHALILGRAMTGASLIASLLKGEERVIVQAEGDGLVKLVYAEALQVGEVRGFIRQNDKPSADRNSPLGEGLLKVQKLLYGKYEPVTGIVELNRGDITSDLSHYLTQSEQVPSVFVIDISFDEQDIVKESVGMLIQALPGALPEDIFKTYDSVDYLDRLTEFAERGYNPEEILRQMMPSEITVNNSSPVDFFCRCSLDRFKGMLLTLGIDEVRGMHGDGQNELVCQYCAEKYYLAEDDFQELITQSLVKRN